ncbi:MAG TPA: restriction endonuclease, partial [bacterium]|nr:restriction endonuclease [bacterium]
EVVDRTAPAEIEIRATDPKPMVGGLYIIHGVLRDPDDYVGPEQVMSLKDIVKEEGAIKGFLLTNGLFAAPAAQMLDAQKLELINGPTLLGILAAPARPA